MNGKVTVDQLAQVIRTVDGGHSLGAAALAEAILEALPHLQPAKPEAVRLRDELRSFACEAVEYFREGSDVVDGDYGSPSPNKEMKLLSEGVAALAATGKQQVPDSVIRDVFLRNGFTIKEGQDDLKPYVYAAARELLGVGTTGKQQVGSPTQQFQEWALENYRKQQVGEVQGDGLVISDEDRAVLQRIQDALPMVGINGWTKGVEVLERLLRDSLAARQQDQA